MMTFERHRTSKEMRAECKARGWKLCDREYQKGSDFLRIDFVTGRMTGWFLYNVTNGRFFGQLRKPRAGVVDFTSDTPRFDRTRWMRSLLSACYVGKVRS